MDADHDVDDRLDLRGLVLPERRSHPVHARPGRQRAESPLRARRPTGRSSDLTPGEKLKAQFAAGRAIAASFYVATNERDPRFFDLYRYDARTLRADAVVFKNDLGYLPDGISPDGKWVALTKPNTTNDSDLYLWNAATGEATAHLRRTRVRRRTRPPTFDPASASFYYLTNDGSEFTRAAPLFAGGGHARGRREGRLGHRLVQVLLEAARYRVTRRERGRRAMRLRVVETPRGKPVPLPQLPDGDVTGVELLAQREAAGVLRQRGPLAERPLHADGRSRRDRCASRRRCSKDLDAADLVDTRSCASSRSTG